MNKDAYLKIQRAADQCKMCGANIADSSRHPSILHAEGEEGLQRLDYCAECWEKLRDDEFFSFWMAKREKSVERTKLTREERNRLMLAYFEHLTTFESDETAEAKRYFVAHLLMRFRLFRWARTDHEAGIVVFEDARNGDEWTVRQVNLDDDAALAIKQEVEEFLRKGQDIDVQL